MFDTQEAPKKNMKKKSLIVLLSLLVTVLLLGACQALQAKTEPPESEISSGLAKDPSGEVLSNDGSQKTEDALEPDSSTNGAGLENEPDQENRDSVEQETQPPAKRYAVNPKTYRIEPFVEDENSTSKEDQETEKQEKIVLLTFDDTPTGDATYDILDLLDQYGAKAIFFVNGHYAEKNVDTLHEIKNRGHLIGNHTWWHIYIRKENPETVRDEIVRLNDFIEEELGERPVYFRPPFGQNSDVSLEIIREEGMQTMNWSNGSLDWELKSPEAVVEQVLSNIKSGDNILFHDKRITAEALGPILKELTDQGYKFVLPTEVIVPE